MENSDEYYKMKYFKYKAKYELLKEQLGGTHKNTKGKKVVSYKSPKKEYIPGIKKSPSAADLTNSLFKLSRNKLFQDLYKKGLNKNHDEFMKLLNDLELVSEPTEQTEQNELKQKNEIDKLSLWKIERDLIKKECTKGILYGNNCDSKLAPFMKDK